MPSSESRYAKIFHNLVGPGSSENCKTFHLPWNVSKQNFVGTFFNLNIKILGIMYELIVFLCGCIYLRHHLDCGESE